MKEFFKSTRFKILLAVLIVLFAFLLRAAYTGGLSTFFSNALSAITNPLQKVSTYISSSTHDFFNKFFHAGEIEQENEELKEQVRKLTEQLADYDKTKQENDLLKNFLEIKDQNPDFDFEPAWVIDRDPNSRFFSFTIDKGSLHGISVNDPVITEDGVVGIVKEVGLTFSKVETILDPAVNVGCYDVKTRDPGVIAGDISLAAEGYCKFSYLSRESGAAAGDIVLTSGMGGLFPKGLIIGTIREVKTEPHGISLYAVVEPTSDIQNIKDVLVIKSFLGQETGDNSLVQDSSSSESDESQSDAASSSEPSSSQDSSSSSDVSSSSPNATSEAQSSSSATASGGG